MRRHFLNYEMEKRKMVWSRRDDGVIIIKYYNILYHHTNYYKTTRKLSIVDYKLNIVEE